MIDDYNDYKMVTVKQTRYGPTGCYVPGYRVPWNE